MSGRAFLVGGGPGDPGLLTLRAVEVLREADVVLFDRLAPPEALAYAPADAELVDVGKVGGGEQVPQEETVRLLRRPRPRRPPRRPPQGRRPLRLRARRRGGAGAARRGLPFEVVPGVTAGVAAPAYAGHPRHAARAWPARWPSSPGTRTRARRGRPSTGRRSPPSPGRSSSTWASGGSPRIAEQLVAARAVARRAGRRGAAGHAARPADRAGDPGDDRRRGHGRRRSSRRRSRSSGRSRRCTPSSTGSATGGRSAA